MVTQIFFFVNFYFAFQLKLKANTNCRSHGKFKKLGEFVRMLKVMYRFKVFSANYPRYKNNAYKENNSSP